MYRITLLILFLLFFFNQSAKSQETIVKKGRMSMGVEAGIQFTGVDDSYAPISDGGIGYSAGPFFDYFISNSTKFRVGLNFDNRAFSLQDINIIVDDSGNYGNSYYDVFEEYNVNYLTIPLSLVFMKGNGKLKFFIQGTLYYSLLISSQQSGYTDVYITESDANKFYFEDYPELSIPGHHYLEPYQQALNTNDIGISILLGIIYDIKPNLGLSLSPGFSYSFADVFENPERQANWSQLYKINVGIVYTLNSRSQ